MARPRREDIESDNRREELIIAAAHLFRDKGYHGTSVREIARSINMRAGSPFYHFANKEDLLFACVEKGLKACLAELDAIDGEELSAFDRFRALTRTHLKCLLENRQDMLPLVVNEWQHLEGRNREEIMALRQRFELLWLKAFSDLNKAGLAPRADKLSCWFFLGALHAIPLWYDPQGKLSITELADRLVEETVRSARSPAARKL